MSSIHSRLLCIALPLPYRPVRSSSYLIFTSDTQQAIGENDNSGKSSPTTNNFKELSGNQPQPIKTGKTPAQSVGDEQLNLDDLTLPMLPQRSQCNHFNTSQTACNQIKAGELLFRWVWYPDRALPITELYWTEPPAKSLWGLSHFVCFDLTPE